MATVTNYSTVPAVVTIVNIDPGEIDRENTKVENGALVTAYLREPETQKVQLDRVNFWVEIAPTDSLKIVVSDSEALAYYMALNSDKLQVTFVAV